jgi:hypothetical protein
MIMINQHHNAALPLPQLSLEVLLSYFIHPFRQPVYKPVSY